MSTFNLIMRIISLILVLIFLIYTDFAFENGDDLRSIFNLSKMAFAFSAWSWIDITFKND